MCKTCFTRIRAGIRHRCTPTTRMKNIKAFVQRSVSKRFPGQLISSLLKDKVQEIPKKGNVIEMSLPTSHGRPIRVVINPPQNKKGVSVKFVVSTDDMQKIQTNYNLTQNQTIGIASMIRVASNNRKAIEPNLKQKMSDKLHSVDQFFEVKPFNFTVIKAGNVTNVIRHVAYCKNVAGLIEYVKDVRHCRDVHLKFGIDGGGGFLKVNLSIQSKEATVAEVSRQTYNDGVASKRFSDRGVKKIFILGIVKSAQENYGNVAELWSAININPFVDTIAVDLKLANIIAGLMSHSSAHPCTYCFAEKKKLSEPAELRTIGSIVDYYSEWCDAGESTKKAKNYCNCIYEPLFTGDDNTVILDVIPPPELHLMLGVVNTIFDHMNPTNLKWTPWHGQNHAT